MHQCTFLKTEAVGYWEGFETRFPLYHPHSCWSRWFNEKKKNTKNTQSMHKNSR